MKAVKQIGMIILGCMVLGGCSSNSSDSSDKQNTPKADENSADSNQEQTKNDKEDTTDEQTNEKVDKPAQKQKSHQAVDDGQIKNPATTKEKDDQSDNKAIPGVDKKTYKSEAAADKQIKPYHRVKHKTVDLGHDIKGSQDGATGHLYTQWNEGRWLLQVDAPTDASNAVKDFKSGKKTAKKVVAYLEDHYLPPPHDKGKITISTWKDHPGTKVKWQDHRDVYTIRTNHHNPVQTLRKVTNKSTTQG